MNSKDLEAIFASKSLKRGHALILDERWTLALIDVAQEHDVAVVGIELHRPAEDQIHSDRSSHTLGLAVDRSESWRQAREFVSYLAGKGATFEVLLEAPQTTQGVRLRDGMVVPGGFWRPSFAGFFLPFLLVVGLMIALFMMGGG